MRTKQFLGSACQVLRTIYQVLRAVIAVFICFALIGNIYIAAAKNLFGQKNSTFFGFSSLVVLTGSMSPEINANDVVITYKQNKYAVGDVITFSCENSLVTHRIIAADEEGYYTKGDANNTADRMTVNREFITGKVIFVIPQIGALIGFIRTPIGILCFLMLIVFIVELPSIVKLFKTYKDSKRAKEAENGTPNKKEKN